MPVLQLVFQFFTIGSKAFCRRVALSRNVGSVAAVKILEDILSFLQNQFMDEIYGW